MFHSTLSKLNQVGKYIYLVNARDKLEVSGSRNNV